jgi:hypothetical protein
MFFNSSKTGTGIRSATGRSIMISLLTDMHKILDGGRIFAQSVKIIYRLCIPLYFRAEVALVSKYIYQLSVHSTFGHSKSEPIILLCFLL